LDVDLLPFIGNLAIWERSLARGASCSAFKVAFLAHLAGVAWHVVSRISDVVVASFALPTLAI